MKKPSLKTWRRVVQVSIVLLFIAVPILNKNRYSLFYGNLLSFQFWFIPLADPLAILQLTLKNLYFTLNNFFGALIPLLLAFFLGTVFCSWMCPFGYLSEMTYLLRKKIFPTAIRRGAESANLQWIKFFLFTIGLALFIFFSTTPVLNQLSLPAWYTRFFQYYFGQGYFSLSILVILGVLAIEFILHKRIWCRFVCPQSVLIIFAKRLNKKRLMVHFQPEKCLCKNEAKEHCTASCTLSLNPKKVGRAQELECTNCGDCIGACERVGKALTFKFRGK